MPQAHPPHVSTRAGDSPQHSGLSHYIVQGALGPLGLAFWGMAGSFVPAGPGQPLWLEIAVHSKGSHSAVFAPYHSHGISVLETISAPSCLSSSSTFYLKHIWVLGLRKQEAYRKRYCLWGSISPGPLSVCHSFWVCESEDTTRPVPVDLAQLGRACFSETTVSRWIRRFLQAAFFLFCQQVGNTPMWGLSPVALSVFCLAWESGWALMNKQAQRMVAAGTPEWILVLYCKLVNKTCTILFSWQSTLIMKKTTMGGMDKAIVFMCLRSDKNTSLLILISIVHICNTNQLSMW